MATVSNLDLLTVTEAAEELGLSEPRVYQLCQEKRLGQKVGRSYVIPRRELETFKKQDRPPGNPGFRK